MSFYLSPGVYINQFFLKYYDSSILVHENIIRQSGVFNSLLDFDYKNNITYDINNPIDITDSLFTLQKSLEIEDINIVESTFLTVIYLLYNKNIDKNTIYSNYYNILYFNDYFILSEYCYTKFINENLDIWTNIYGLNIIKEQSDPYDSSDENSQLNSNSDTRSLNENSQLNSNSDTRSLNENSQLNSNSNSDTRSLNEKDLFVYYLHILGVKYFDDYDIPYKEFFIDIDPYIDYQDNLLVKAIKFILSHFYLLGYPGDNDRQVTALYTQIDFIINNSCNIDFETKFILRVVHRLFEMNYYTEHDRYLQEEY